MARQPNAETYNLGHYEQMVLGLALELAAESVTESTEEIDVEVLRDFIRIFSTAGTIQITKVVEA